MRGHSSTPLVTCSPIHLPKAAPPLPRSTGAAIIGSFVRRARRRLGSLLGRLVIGGLTLGPLLGGMLGCDSGYGNYGVWQTTGSVPYTGRTALTWTVNGTPLTTALCQTDHIDSMTVQFISENDSQSAAEFLEVACALSRYSVTMIPIGPLRIYVNAIHTQRNQNDCVLYAGIAHGTATDQFPANPLPIDLKTVGSCP